MRRPFVRRHSLIPCFSQRLDVPCERFANRFKAVQLLLLLIDRLVQFFDLVFVKADLCFDVFQALFIHGLSLCSAMDRGCAF